MGFGQAKTFYFTPPRAGEYVFHGLPGGAESAFFTARVTDSTGRVMGQASGEGSFAVPVVLAAGVRYELRVTSQGRAQATVEVMENAYGRSIDRPTRLTGGSVRYTRAIVSARDTHWYSFMPPRDGWYTVRTESAGETPLDTRGTLLDDRWREIAENDDILFPGDGNFRICAYLTGGKPCYIRVSAGSNQTGSYRLIVAMPESAEALPTRIALTETSVTVRPGESRALDVTMRPENALTDVAWASEDSGIASVAPDGTVTGVSAGRTVVHAFAGRLEVVCEVNVTPIALTGLAFETDTVRVAQHDAVTLAPVFTPADASDRRLIFESADEAVATVDSSGTVTGVSPGETVVSARSASGLVARAVVTVTEPLPVYRALVLGEQNYETGRTRLGGLNTAEGVAETLRQQSVFGRRYDVHVQIDSTRESLLEAIDETFGGAREDDVSLFYINCHGDYDDTAWIELHDGTRVTAVQLEQLLRGIPGRVVVIVDCCRSGAFLGDSAAADRFTSAVCDAFRAGGAQSSFASGKYIVITSAGPDEDSYRRSFSNDSDEGSMATILARSLCEGAGWDIIGDKMCTLKADANRDRVVYYLEGTGVKQTVRVWPEGDQTALFGRA